MAHPWKLPLWPGRLPAAMRLSRRRQLFSEDLAGSTLGPVAHLIGAEALHLEYPPLVGDQPEHQWAGDPRVRDVVGGLVSDIAWDAKVSTLSGGQRRRVQLAELLVGEWDVIALDEPTTHLDIEGITWRATHLRQRWARNTGGLFLGTP